MALTTTLSKPMNILNNKVLNKSFLLASNLKYPIPQYVRDISVSARRGRPPAQPQPAASQGQQPRSQAQAAAPEVPKTLTDAFLIQEFANTYPQLAGRVDTADKIRSLVNISKEVREWYLTLKEDVSTTSSLPDAMQLGGCTPEMWREAQGDLEKARILERESANKVNAAAREFKVKLDTIAAEKKRFYQRCSNLVIISRVTQEQLPLESQVEVALETDPDKRKSLARDFIADLQTQLVQDHLDGSFINPFA